MFLSLLNQDLFFGRGDVFRFFIDCYFELPERDSHKSWKIITAKAAKIILSWTCSLCALFQISAHFAVKWLL